jgi:hypothetical protein
MRNHIHFFFGDSMDLAQSAARSVTHHDEPVGQLGDLFQHKPLMRIGTLQNRVQRGHQRHAQSPQKREHVAAAASTEDAIFVLQTDEFDFIDIQEIAAR